MQRILFILVLSLVWAVQAAAQDVEYQPLYIETGAGDVHAFQVELADEPDEIATGYMFRESVGEFEGMLFDFGEVREANMYMKNVPISLDMLFLNEDGEIAAIARHAAPQSLRIINPGFPVAGVLEIAGGRAQALNLQIGDVVRHDMFDNALNE